MVKAIDTFYKNNYFRSRLEARWAYCFDLFGIRYEYETDGVLLSNGVKYLPDFYLPDYNSFAEVKPAYQSSFLHKDNVAPNCWIMCHEDYFKKWLPFSEKQPLIILIGKPGEYMPLQLRPEFFEYKECGVLVEAQGLPYFSNFDPRIIEANKKRFEHILKS